MQILIQQEGQKTDCKELNNKKELNKKYYYTLGEIILRQKINSWC